jgi:membrane fusion protein, heavy metal efflux system
MMNVMKRTLAISSMTALALTYLGACGDTKSAKKNKSEHGAAEGDHGHGHGGDSIAVLKFGKHTEIFVEYPAPVAGKEMTFTTHFTLLGKRFLPVRKGSLAVIFQGASGEARRIKADRPSRTGIFEPKGKAPAAGEYTLIFELDAEGKRDRFAWRVVVYPSQTAADHRPKEPEPAGKELSFLKEQQWVIPFATATAERRPMRAGLEVAGTVKAEPGAHVRLTAPIAGVVAEVLPTLRVGARVKKSQTLASLEPVMLQGIDLPQLQVAVIHARQALKLAELRRDRLKAMFRARAVAQLQVDQAEYEVKRQKAALTAAGSRLWLHQRSRKRQTKSGHGLSIRAPFASTVLRREVTTGAAVKAGQLLVELADLARLRVVAHVSPDSLARARQATGASMRLPSGRWVSLKHPPSAGASVDPTTRTVPIAYGYAAAEALSLGSWVRVKLLGPARTAVAVPEAAVLDNDGQAVVLVQTGGESFVMRKVGLGIRDRGFVEVTLGVRDGERVVTVGGYQMLLASKLRGGAQLGHGHAH